MNKSNLKIITSLFVILVAVVIGYSLANKKNSENGNTISKNTLPPPASGNVVKPSGVTGSTVSSTKLSYYLNLKEPDTFTISYKGISDKTDFTIYKSLTKYRFDNRVNSFDASQPKEIRQFGFGTSGYNCRIAGGQYSTWQCATTPNQCGDKVYSYGTIFDKAIFKEPFSATSPFIGNKGYVGKQRIAGVDAACFELQLQANLIGSYGPSGTICFHPTKFLVMKDLVRVATSLNFNAVSSATFDPPQPVSEHSQIGFCAIGS